MPSVPDFVTQAIQNYQPLPGFTVLPKRRGERSLILDWGVRVSCTLDDKAYTGWICMGSRACQRENKIIQLFGNTSKATKHLADVHRESSKKTLAETSRKRSRQQELQRIGNAIASADDSRRMTLLLETLRIVRNNLPFCFGENDESELLADLVIKEEFRATINRHTVCRAIVELYDASKGGATLYLDTNRLQNVPSLAMMVDFWSSKSQPGKKYLGLRVCLIDNQWDYQSILLGTRYFEPLYGERCEGYRAPFKRWIMELLQNFGLKLDDFFGATTDAGPDVKWMIRTGLSLEWTWCVSHLTNAATKTAFGIVAQRSASKNPVLTDLISRIVKTVYAIRSNEAMGSLFHELCQQLQLGGATQLLSYKEHRFMGLTRVIRRILQTWEALELWFEERRAKAIRARKDPPQDFPLVDDKITLLQLLAMLDPITMINIRAQSESANQVEVLLSLYSLRMTVLDETAGLKDRYRSASEPPIFYRVHELTPSVKTTRHLLGAAFQRNFIVRYTDRAKMRETSYIPEAQMCLHPVFKNPDKGLAKIVRVCSSQLVIDPSHPHLRTDEQTIQRNVDKVKECVRKCIISIMLKLVEAEANTHGRPGESAFTGVESMLTMAPLPPVAYSEELTDMFGEHPGQVAQHSGQESRVEEEFDRWLADTLSLERNANDQTESILEFWKRQEDTNTYHFLPRVARILFAVPSSSAAIERDFGVSGMMVTSQRSSLSSHNIEMCAFLNRNRQFTDVTQCRVLSDEEYENAIPTSMLVDLEPNAGEQSMLADWGLDMLSTVWGNTMDEVEQD
ncbi:hypothetical protein DVH05_022578 [Phytophthora capsici]|nr:hypothetical protein DVH05_022578 [Phytophthora capsici]